MEYSIQFISSCRPKKFGVNLINENNKKDFRYFFEAMMQNTSLHDDVSTDKAKAFDKKNHLSDAQVNFYNSQAT